MGTYLFERHTDDGAGGDAGASLGDDVARALEQIHWVDHFTVHAGDGDILRVDVMFDDEWPELRASEPEYVATLFHRFGLRTIPNPAFADIQADDPLAASLPRDDGSESMDMFLFKD